MLEKFEKHLHTWEEVWKASTYEEVWKDLHEKSHLRIPDRAPDCLKPKKNNNLFKQVLPVRSLTFIPLFFPPYNQDYDENLSSAMLTRLKTEMLVRQESIINQVSQRGVPSNSLAMRKADGGGGGDDVR